MAMYYLTESDRKMIAETIMRVMDQRQNVIGRDTQTTFMAPEVYIVNGTVPPRYELPDGTIIAGKRILPIYRLFPYDPYNEPGDDVRWKIIPVLMQDGTQKELEIFNVRECSPPDDYNYIWRDKFGRWHIDFYCCEEPSSMYSVFFSSSSESSSAQSAAPSLGMYSCGSAGIPAFGMDWTWFEDWLDIYIPDWPKTTPQEFQDTGLRYAMVPGATGLSINGIVFVCITADYFATGGITLHQLCPWESRRWIKKGKPVNTRPSPGSHASI